MADSVTRPVVAKHDGVGDVGQFMTFATDLIHKELSAQVLSNDLFFSPDHRLSLYQRVDHLGDRRTEVIGSTKDLVNGNGILQVTRDYRHILFDRHFMICAEGLRHNLHQQTL